MLSIFEGYGEVVAEDLGMVPPFLRPSLQELGIPGYKVLRWEKDATARTAIPRPGRELSVATTGTHDIETNAEWYDALPPRSARRCWSCPA